MEKDPLQTLQGWFAKNKEEKREGEIIKYNFLDIIE